MITPFLESFPEDFSVEVDGDTYTAKLAGNEVAERRSPRRGRLHPQVQSRVRY